MSIIVEQVDTLKEFGKFFAASSFASGETYQYLTELEIAEDESPALYKKEPKHKRIRWVRLPRVSVSLKSDVESDLRLEYHGQDLPCESSESPFDVLDEMQPDEEKVRELINFIRNKSIIRFAPKLAARLHFLYEAVEEDPDAVPVSPESLSHFIYFLQNTPKLKYPDVVLTPSNEIRAQWRTAPNRHFAVVFLSNGKTRYVIFSPNQTDPDRIDRVSGTTYVDTLMDKAEPHRVLDWASL